jgi:hypothetical protein
MKHFKRPALIWIFLSLGWMVFCSGRRSHPLWCHLAQGSPVAWWSGTANSIHIIVLLTVKQNLNKWKRANQKSPFKYTQLSVTVQTVGDRGIEFKGQGPIECRTGARVVAASMKVYIHISDCHLLLSSPLTVCVCTDSPWVQCLWFVGRCPRFVINLKHQVR